MKREHSNIQQIYTETVNLEMEDLPPFVEQGVIEFFPHVGHCLCLRSWLPNNPMMAETDVNIPGLELKVNLNHPFRIVLTLLPLTVLSSSLQRRTFILKAGVVMVRYTSICKIVLVN